MAYIGKQLTIGNFVKLDTITTSATTTFNLLSGGVAYSPQSANHCIVSLNGVIQSPNTSFTISGSTIVFASALTATDVIDFILVLGNVLNIGTPSDATVGFSKITSNLITGATAETAIAGADSLLIYDDSASALRKMTRTNFVSGLLNNPYFRAERTTNQTTTTYVGTKIQFNTVTFDSASGFDNTTNYRYTIPSGQGGYWLIQISMGTYFSSNNGGAFNVDLRKNGSTIQSSVNVTVDSGTSIYRHRNQTITAILNLSAGDYLEGFGMLVGTTPAIRGDANETFIQGFRLSQ